VVSPPPGRLPLALEFVFGGGYLAAAGLNTQPGMHIDQLLIEVPDLRFPLGVGAGLERFRPSRGRVRWVGVSLDLDVVARGLTAARPSDASDGPVTLVAEADGLWLGVPLDHGALWSRWSPSPDGGTLCLQDLHLFGTAPTDPLATLRTRMAGWPSPRALHPGHHPAWDPLSANGWHPAPLRPLLGGLFLPAGWKLPALEALHQGRWWQGGGTRLSWVATSDDTARLERVLLDRGALVPDGAALWAPASPVAWHADDLDEALGDRDPRVRRAAVGACLAVGRGTPPLETLQAGDTDPGWHLLRARTLAAAGALEPAHAALQAAASAWTQAGRPWLADAAQYAAADLLQRPPAATVLVEENRVAGRVDLLRTLADRAWEEDRIDEALSWYRQILEETWDEQASARLTEARRRRREVERHQPTMLQHIRSRLADTRSRLDAARPSARRLGEVQAGRPAPTDEARLPASAGATQPAAVAVPADAAGRSAGDAAAGPHAAAPTDWTARAASVAALPDPAARVAGWEALAAACPEAGRAARWLARAGATAYFDLEDDGWARRLLATAWEEDEAAVLGDPESTSAWEYLCEDAGRRDVLARIHGHAAALDSDDTERRVVRLLLQADALAGGEGGPLAALTVLEEALALQPGLSAARLREADWRYAAGQTDQALAIWQGLCEGASLDPVERPVVLHRWATHAAGLDPVHEARAWSLLLEVEPASTEALAALRRLHAEDPSQVEALWRHELRLLLGLEQGDWPTLLPALAAAPAPARMPAVLQALAGAVEAAQGHDGAIPLPWPGGLVPSWLPATRDWGGASAVVAPPASGAPPTVVRALQGAEAARDRARALPTARRAGESSRRPTRDGDALAQADEAADDGRLEEALAHLEQALRAQPRPADRVPLLRRKGRWLGALQHWDLAMQALKGAWIHAPTDPDLRRELATACEGAGRHEEARRLRAGDAGQGS
jgi:tetratricopeptide (TPR) repeat protein